MVWGGISLDGRTNLQVIDKGALTAVSYVRHFVSAVMPAFIPMQDYARVHTARVVIGYLDQGGSDVMD